MPTPRTATVAQAAAIVVAKVNVALANLNEGGSTEDARRHLTRYFSQTRAEQMMNIIFADVTTETPVDVRATFEAKSKELLTQAIFNAAI